MKHYEAIDIAKKENILKKIIIFMIGIKRMDLGKKAETRNQFFKSLSFLCTLKDTKRLYRFKIKDKYA